MSKPKQNPETPHQLKHRLEPNLFAAVVARAEAERRSVSNLVEVALLQYLDKEPS